MEKNKSVSNSKTSPKKESYKESKLNDLKFVPTQNKSKLEDVILSKVRVPI